MSGHGSDPTFRSEPTWIVELRTVASDDWARTPIIFHGDVVSQRHPPGTAWATVTIRHSAPDEPLQLTPERLDLRVRPSDLPPALTVGPAHDLDHVVHMWCAGGLGPEAIEGFLEATRGIASRYALGREAWLEVLSHAVDPDGGETDEPMFDDIFLGRYRNPDAVDLLDADPRWSQASSTLHAQAPHRLDLVIQPVLNRIAEHR